MDDEFLEDKIDVLEQEVSNLRAKLQTESHRKEKLTSLERENASLKAHMTSMTDRLRETYHRLIALTGKFRSEQERNIILIDLEIANSHALYSVAETLGLDMNKVSEDILRAEVLARAEADEKRSEFP